MRFGVGKEVLGVGKMGFYAAYVVYEAFNMALADRKFKTGFMH
jgi:hypothetical protein